MMILTATNVTDEGKLEREDGTADYDVDILINQNPIWGGRIEGHIREMGAAELLHVIAEHMEAEEDVMEHKKPFLVG